MDFPKRHVTHVSETASFKRLEQFIPNHWIVRHASERDYGVDLLIEPVIKPDGPVTGDLMAIQLKGTEKLPWRDGHGKAREATFSGTKVSTINYWMGLPLPVVLCVHEQDSGGLLMAAVKRQVRRRYGEALKQSTFAFQLTSDLDLSEDHGHVLLYALYVAEKARSDFAEALVDLLVNRDLYIDYILGNFQRDSFMEVETPQVVRFARFHRHVQIVAQSTGIDWQVPSVRALIAEDQELFKDTYALLHELTHGKTLCALAPVFLEAVRKGCRLVAEVEYDYWLARDYLLSRYVTENTLNDWHSQAEQQLSNL